MEQLIPFENIAGWGVPGGIILIILLAVFFVVLHRGASWLVDGAALLAQRLGIPKIIIGATVISLGTTTPEAAVSVLSAFQGNSGLALGNAIGSVICDTGLVFGLGCVLTVLPLDRFILNRHGWIQLSSGILLVVMICLSALFYPSPVITRGMGIGFLVLLVGYLVMSVRWAKSHPSEIEDIPDNSKSISFCLIMVIVGLLLVIFSSQFLIADVETICHLLNIPQSIISATVVAFGTSLPELMTALTSIRRGHPELLVGNVLGADILNIFFVIGASATASALPVPKEVLFFQLPFMIVILLVFRFFSSTGRQTYKRVWGIPLLSLYFIFILLAFLYGIKPI